MTPNKNVLLIKGMSQYDAMRNYIDEIELGFRLAGYNTCVLDALEESYMFQYTELMSSVKIDITFVCNAILEKRIPDTYYMTYLTDHPAMHKKRLEKLDDRSCVFVCDRRHKAYIQQYCPNIKYVEYIPLSGEYSKKYIPFNNRSRNIIFTGSYDKPGKMYNAIFGCDSDWNEIVKYMAESIIKNPKQDLEMCLKNCFALFDIELSEQEFHEQMSFSGGIDRYARAFYRDKVIRTLVKSGLCVHVFGNGWENFEGDGSENLIIEKGNFYVARKAVADSKISINVMPWFKDGFQERIAAAMLSGTVAVTDESKYIKENFSDGKEMVLYSLEQLDELPEKVNWLLSHPKEAEAIARMGHERAEKEMTWQHRTFEMICYIQEIFSLPAPPKGKYGEIIRIPFSIMHERTLLLDIVNSLNEIIEMISQVRLYNQMDLQDIDFFYTKFLNQFVKLNTNFPEISFSEFIYNYLMNLKGGQVNEGTELLILECMHILAVLLSMENSELNKEKAALKSLIDEINNMPNRHSWNVLIQKLKFNYNNSQDEDIQEILRNIQKNNFVSAYNQDFTQKYFGGMDSIRSFIHYDAQAKMYFTIWKDKRMYYPKEYSEDVVISAVNFTYLEQDEKSPHRYLEGTFKVNEGDIVVDAGVAEGNFALEVIDKAKKVYLVECNHIWIDALRKTFEPWKEKVVIIEKMLGNTNNEQYASLDQIVEEGYVNFLKLDVEGAEISSLKGASKILLNSKNIKCAVCAYHRKNAEKDIRNILENYGFYTSTTKGYMFFKEDIDSWIKGELRHGIVRAIK